MDPVKLAKLQAQAASSRIGGKGTVRRKVVRKAKPAGAQDDKKLQAALKKLNVQPIAGVEEVNMFQEDGNVLHFTAPKVHASVAANTFAIYGAGHVKELTELVPGILNQLGPDSLASLRKLAESYQSLQEGQRKQTGEDDDDVPDLVENFEEATLKEGETKEEGEEEKEEEEEEAKEEAAEEEEAKAEGEEAN